MLDKKLTKDVEPVMKSAIGRTQSYFNSEYGINVTESRSESGDLDSLTLLDMTAIIGMGGGVNLLIAFSFQDALIDTLFKRMSADFDVAPDEIEMYREAAAGEAVNTILGHSTIDLQQANGPPISMTPPVILDRVKTIRRMKNAMFYTRSLDTDFGRMNISLVGPQELFDTRLDYVK
ncbi:MAG: chemotaxis protein CheX [Azonexus sp.]|nr:chemotaxis protein CheX [Azonexus sp.]